MSNDLTTLRIKVIGQVHGVGYREFAIAEANARELIGWVRNRSDGTVEVVVSGPQKDVEAFVGACMRGPPGARVTNVEMGPAEVPDTIGFKRRPTV